MKEAEILNFLVQNKEVVFASILVFASLTQIQRNAIVRRDQGKCQAERIGMTSKHGGRLEVNHTPPQAWSMEHGLDPDEYPVISLLTLCQKHHDEYHRGDVARAKEEYHQGNKDSFGQMARRHHVLSQQEEIFWESEYDTAIQTVSRQNDKVAKSWGWNFPPRGRRKKQ